MLFRSKPLVIEFAGVPKAGKTTTLTNDTSLGDTRGDPKRTAEVVVEAILGLIEEQVAEDIMSCSKESVVRSFAGKRFLQGSQAADLTRHFCEVDDTRFRPREEVEPDDGRVQAIPIVVVRNASGEVLVFAAEKKRLTIRSMRRSSSGLEDTSGVRTPSMALRWSLAPSGNSKKSCDFRWISRLCIW